MTILRQGVVIQGDAGTLAVEHLHEGDNFIYLSIVLDDGPIAEMVVQTTAARTLAEALLAMADIIEKQAHKGWDGREVEKDCL